MKMSACPRQPRPSLFSHGDRLRQATLERAANLLLASDPLAQGGDYPCRMEYRNTEDCRRRMAGEPGCLLSRPAHGRLQALRLLGHLGLGPRHRLAFRLTARGGELREVATLLGVSVKRVINLNAETCRAMRRALGDSSDDLLGPREALRAVYREEVSRRGYTPEKHCPPGQEECRRSGLCVRRWYLYYEEEAA